MKRAPATAGEFELIDAFVACFPRARTPRGPGDDCALLPPSRRALCVTTDAVVEDVHFRRATFRPEDIGHKALAVNLSDLAAMGAEPAWFVCALALPPDFGREACVRLGRGMARLARESGIALVGGNVTRARELSVTLTVAGHAPARPLLRSGGRAGDLLYVSGRLGEARHGLRELEAGVRRGAAVERQRRPTPRLALGRLAARFASAGMDLSDGLAQDLGHLARASRVAARVVPAWLPVSPALARVLGLERARAEALAGGEDYELLLAVPPARARAFERACGRGGHTVTCVGALARGPAGRVILEGSRGAPLRDALGRPVALPAGHDHLAGRPGR
ncbi:thiamine-phosphate kinase [Aggregicoccus sp. 17bor-14]|uniref:thiamine-phosphate kinase n=1 Tax=Myxococcaceae TaxID=31 RepID=UPI0012F25A66|nr:thiamine-phosphate kinase [Simulacricoccus sp. 17bor-14]MRI87529.1 thiamine-phosphate kinase [Aggregicoccus sp. 17bor-14]